MREIKFRVWDEDKKQMWRPEFIANPRGCPAKWETDGTMHIFYHQISMQYTGIKDKNGKEIYEGDIMDARSECGGIHAVKFLYEHHIIGLGIDCSGCMGMEQMEVIGNIYENPELIPAQEK